MARAAPVAAARRPVARGPEELPLEQQLLAAIISASAAIRAKYPDGLPREGYNDFQGFAFTSVDMFYKCVVPLVHEHGIHWSVRVKERPRPVPTDKDKDAYVIFDVTIRVRYKGLVVDDYDSFVLTHPNKGAQTVSMAKSAATKAWMREEFKVVTHEEETDHLARDGKSQVFRQRNASYEPSAQQQSYSRPARSRTVASDPGEPGEVVHDAAREAMEEEHRRRMGQRLAEAPTPAASPAAAPALPDSVPQSVPETVPETAAAPTPSAADPAVSPDLDALERQARADADAAETRQALRAALERHLLQWMRPLKVTDPIRYSRVQRYYIERHEALIQQAMQNSAPPPEPAPSAPTRTRTRPVENVVRFPGRDDGNFPYETGLPKPRPPSKR